jgi:hypothetical protein
MAIHHLFIYFITLKALTRMSEVLNVNAKKTRIMILFSEMGIKLRTTKMLFNYVLLDTVNEFHYFGILIIGCQEAGDYMLWFKKN